MTPQRIVRLGLAYLAFVGLQQGLWALFAPQSFYDSFPGLGRTWIAVDGPYNEHLVRDFGALNIALAVLLIFAAIKLTKDLVTVASIASLAWGVPHLLYHVFNTDDLSTSDVIASLGGLAVSVVFAGMLLASAGRLEATPPT